MAAEARASIIAAVTRPTDPLLSVVLPVFNEEAVLPALLARLQSAAATWGVRSELVFVDDGSSDGTLEQLRAAAQADPRLRVVSFARNFGHQVAVSAGLLYAQGDVVAVLDADLQDPPELLTGFLERWRAGFQVVYGVRTKRKESFFKRLAYAAFYRLLRHLVRFEIPLDSGDFCLMDRVVVDAINSMPERTRFVRGLRAWVGFSQCGYVYERAARAAGETKYPFAKLLNLALDGILNFSVRPLAMIAMLGLGSAALAFAGLVFIIAYRLLGIRILGYYPHELPGYASVVLSVLFVGGVQLFALGVIGSYVGRLFEEIKCRPLFTIKEIISRDGAIVSPGAKALGVG